MVFFAKVHTATVHSWTWWWHLRGSDQNLFPGTSRKEEPQAWALCYSWFDLHREAVKVGNCDLQPRQQE